MWDLAARASRLEGELASHQRKLEAIEKRGRALRAEIGRKVEELAGEESRAMREALAERERASRIQAMRAQAEREVGEAQAKLRVQSTAEGWRELGAAEARVTTLQAVQGDYERRAREREQYSESLRKQIDDLKAQLQRYGDALESDLQAGRERIATRVREALGYEKSFMDASALLLEHLSGRPECREILEDVAKQMAEERAADVD